MAKENKRIKKLIGDNGIIEKADYVGLVTIILCVIVSFILIVLGILAFACASDKGVNNE